MAKAPTKAKTAKKSTTKATGISKADPGALKARGFVEGRPDTIPENISPAIKSRLLRDMGEPDWGDIPGAPGVGNEDKVKGPNPGSQVGAAAATGR